MANNEATLLIRIKQLGGEALDKITAGIGALADKAQYVGLALVGFGTAAINSFRDSEKASNELSQAMVNQGVYTAELKKKYDEMASALQRNSTFADEQITSAQATLQAFSGQKEVTQELIQATMDLAAAKGMDLKSAAELVGKTIGTETNALAKQGIVLDETASKTDRMSAVIDGLNSKFGGQAAAAAQGLGSLEQLKNVADDFLEAVGARLAPFISFFTQQLAQFTIKITESKDVMRGFDVIIEGISKGFVILKNVVFGFVEVATTGLLAFGETMNLVMTGQFSKAKDMAVLGYEELGNIIKERKTLLNEELNAIDEQQALYDEQKRQQELTNIQNSENKKAEIKKNTNAVVFSEEQKNAAKLLGLEAKTAADKKKIDEAMLAAKKDTLSTISTLQGSSNKALAAAGKAAGITQIAIETPVAISKALSAFPPPFNFAAAGLVGAAMAAQAARIAGVQLAEGGIVKATPGGIQATIGEGGRDEAVIPLEDGQIPGSKQGNTFIFNGPIMGDENQAMEFAKAIDRNLLRLRQSNQAVAFDADLI